MTQQQWTLKWVLSVFVFRCFYLDEDVQSWLRALQSSVPAALCSCQVLLRIKIVLGPGLQAVQPPYTKKCTLEVVSLLNKSLKVVRSRYLSDDFLKMTWR